MRIVEARDHRMPFEIDDLRPLGGKAHDPIVTSGGNNFSVGDGYSFRRDSHDRGYESDRGSESVWQFAT